MLLDWASRWQACVVEAVPLSAQEREKWNTERNQDKRLSVRSQESWAAIPLPPCLFQLTGHSNPLPMEVSPHLKDLALSSFSLFLSKTRQLHFPLWPVIKTSAFLFYISAFLLCKSQPHQKTASNKLTTKNEESLAALWKIESVNFILKFHPGMIFLQQISCLKKKSIPSAGISSL